MIRSYSFWRDLISKDESSSLKHDDDNSVNIVTPAACGPQWINPAVCFRNKCKTVRCYIHPLDSEKRISKPAHYRIEQE